MCCVSLSVWYSQTGSNSIWSLDCVCKYKYFKYKYLNIWIRVVVEMKKASWPAKSIYKQECIPVGCVLTTTVAATRCRYSGGLPTGGSTYYGEGVSIRGQSGWTPPSLWTDKRFWKHDLPLAVGKNNLTPESKFSLYRPPSIDQSVLLLFNIRH